MSNRLERFLNAKPNAGVPSNGAGERSNSIPFPLGPLQKDPPPRKKRTCERLIEMVEQELLDEDEFRNILKLAKEDLQSNSVTTRRGARNFISRLISDIAKLDADREKAHRGEEKIEILVTEGDESLRSQSDATA